MNTNRILAVLSLHGYASVAEAKADMVTFGCFDCGSIASVTPLPALGRTEEGRIQQRDALGWGTDWCCGESFVL